MTSPALDDLEGRVIAERYRLVRKIGEGGMATVWEAEHMTLGSSVAVKLMRHGAQQSRQARERFLREARMSAQVRHRNVVEIQDFGVTPDGIPFLVMELLRGETLAQLLQRDGSLTQAEAARTMSLVLRGLLAVHEKGIIHRDLKPQNVFIVEDPDGRYPKLLDFGVCRSAAIEGDAKNLTLEGTIVGTLEYMSPEQARGKKDVDARTDVYAAGVILYEALTGRLPYESKFKGDLLVKVVSEEPVPVLDRDPTIAPPIAAVVMKAIAKAREDRHETAREMRDALFVAARAGGFANVESGVVPRLEAQARIARSQAETLADDPEHRALGAPPALAAASEPPPRAAPRRRVELVILFALIVAAAVAASLLYPL